MEGLINFISENYGDSDGNGRGEGNSCGYGHSYGKDNGYSNGNRRGRGYGNGRGRGNDYSNGYDYSDGYGRGDSSCYSSGRGIKKIDGMNVVEIDGVPTAIKKIRGNIAFGYVFEKMQLKPCYVVKQNNLFAHGKTV